MKVDYSPFLRGDETLETVSEGTLKKRKFDQAKAASRKIGSGVFASKTEITKSQAREILVGRGVRNQHVLDTLLDLAEIAQEHNRIPYNTYLFSHGLRATLQSIETGIEQEAPAVTQDPVTGELINRTELYLLWDYGFFREPEMTFEAWLDLRHACKTSAFTLGRDVLGKDFHEVHQKWTDFFPQFNPDTLPADGKYTQEDAKKWMGQQGRE
jgi:hypothetical protein